MTTADEKRDLVLLATYLGNMMMADPRAIGEIFERHVRTLARTPARGLLTFATTARLVDGLRCEIEDGPWRFAADLPAKIGGADTAPGPGVLGRGALASCLVIGISRWAARLGVPLDALEVAVEADLDARGELGIGDDIRPGYSEVRYTISLRSSAPKHMIDELLAAAKRFSPYLDVFGRAVALRGLHRVNGEGA
jgi:uncharacterized OsmC-like protein